MHADGDAPEPQAACGDSPGLGEALHRLGEDGRAGLRAMRDALQGLRILVAADVALARGALVRALVCAGLAVALGCSAWLLLMAAAIAALQAAGLSWLAALLAAALLSVAATVATALAAARYFEHTGMQATRRQVARLGLGALDELMRGIDGEGGRDEDAAACAQAQESPGPRP